MATKLSIFIITHNEADRLPQTLHAIEGLSDDVIIIDSGSTDNTIEVAKSFNAKVYHKDWQGYGLQKNYGEEKCTHDWMLNIDADEILSPRLKQEIHNALQLGLEDAAYQIKIAEVFPGETTPHPWAYTLKPVRLYNKHHGRYSSSPVHDRVELKNNTPIKRFKHRIYHKSVRSMGDQIIKLNRYSDQQVADLYARQKTIPTARIPFEFLISFLKAYFLRRHFLRGTYGYITAINYAFSRHLRVAKYYETKRINKNNDQK